MSQAGMRDLSERRSFIRARLEKLHFATPQQAKASFYELSALLDAGRIELTIDRVQGELVIGVKEKHGD